MPRVTNEITLAPEEVRFYDSEGYLVVPGFVRDDAVERLRAETLEVMRDCLGLSVDDLAHARTTADKLRQCGQYRAGSGLDQLVNGAASLSLAGQLLKGDALVDMTPENGCLLVVPRSHRGGQLDAHNAGDGDSHQAVDYDPDLVFPLRMRAGDAVVFSRWTVHGSGRNDSGEPRVAYALQYHRGDVKYLDRKDDEWKLLVEHPRWKTSPVDHLTRENR